MKTYITGKDAALEDSIDNFNALLTKHNLEATQASLINPVPHVWSVHIHNKNCRACFSNGKGATKKAAIASAFGEYFERLSTNYYFSDFYLGKSVSNSDFVHYPSEKWFKIDESNNVPDGLLTPSLWQFYDLDNQLCGTDLVDMQSSNAERGVVALPFEQVSNHQTVYVPVNLVANIYASNGMAAGNTKYEARVQALSEIFERYVKHQILTQSLCLPKIPTNVLKSYQTTYESIEKLAQAGFPVVCYDASLGGKFPVICVVLFNQKNGTCYASFGAHPDMSVALERTVTELLQGRELSQLDVFCAPSFDNDEVADLSNIETHFIDSSGLLSWDMLKNTPDFEFVPWHFGSKDKTSTQQQFECLIDIIQQLKHEVLIMDYDHLGVYACRILAVGMSEIYPPEDLLIANNNMAIHLRDLILSLPKTPLTADEYLAIANKLDDENLDDYARVRELLGLAVQNGDPWHTLRVGELKAMLLLAAGDLETAHTWIEWTIEVNESSFQAQRLQDYKCLLTLVDFALTRDVNLFADFCPAFELLYGRDRVHLMWQYVTGKSAFYGLYAVNEDLNELEAHQKLLAVYHKLHKAML